MPVPTTRYTEPPYFSRECLQWSPHWDVYHQLTSILNGGEFYEHRIHGVNSMCMLSESQDSDILIHCLSVSNWLREDE